MRAEELYQAAQRGECDSLLRSAIEEMGGLVVESRQAVPISTRLTRAAFTAAGVDASTLRRHQYFNWNGTMSASFIPRQHRSSSGAQRYWDSLTGVVAEVGGPNRTEGERREPVEPTWLFVHDPSRHVEVTARATDGFDHHGVYAGNQFNRNRVTGAPLDSEEKVFARFWNAENSNVKLQASGQDGVGLVMPGVLVSYISLRGLNELLCHGRLSVTRAWWSGFRTAANAAMRSGSKDVPAAFFGRADWNPHSGQPAVPEGDWSEAQTRRTALYRNTVRRLMQNRQSLQAQLSNVEQSFKDVDGKLNPDVEGQLKALVEDGSLQAVKVTGRDTHMLFPPLKVQCEEQAYGDDVLSAGTYMLPPVAVAIPHAEGGQNLRILNAETGGTHEHPHVQHGPGSGMPCWGETTEDRIRHEEWAKNLWISSPKDLVHFLTGYLTSLYNGGGGRYAPFQQWCRRVED